MRLAFCHFICTLDPWAKIMVTILFKIDFKFYIPFNDGRLQITTRTKSRKEIFPCMSNSSFDLSWTAFLFVGSQCLLYPIIVDTRSVWRQHNSAINISRNGDYFFSESLINWNKSPLVKQTQNRFLVYFCIAEY